MAISTISTLLFCQEYLDIPVREKGGTFYKNITQDVQDAVTRSNFQKGLILIHTLHTTTGLTTSAIAAKTENSTAAFMVQEDEPLLMEDLKFAVDSGAEKFLNILPLLLNGERPRILNLLPMMSLLKPLGGYKHDNFDIRIVNMGPNERRNGEAHLKAAMMREFVLWSFSDGRLNLGKWQSILFWDFDPKGRGKRKLNIFIIGK